MRPTESTVPGTVSVYIVQARLYRSTYCRRSDDLTAYCTVVQCIVLTRRMTEEGRATDSPQVYHGDHAR